MSGMLSSGREREFYVQVGYTQNLYDMSEANDDADQIVQSPDKFLLPQASLFEAEGGWATCAMTLGLGAAGIMGVMATQGRLAAQVGRGSLTAREWFLLGSAGWLSGALGQEIGVHTFGDVRAYRNHWMAYKLVKSQNRYLQANVLSAAPMFY